MMEVRWLAMVRDEGAMVGDMWAKSVHIGAKLQHTS